ncbi:MAG: 4-hydroxy-tetrahydrodipicolinate synthase [Acidaminococcaceae bacterium]|nr:4-hydroxy-tetrahydrodipicolinate synthase [Acidaminococcaceae bacterium]
MTNPYFGRLLTAMVTPFNAGGVDTLAMGRHAQWLVEHGSDGLVVCGSTGEAATMTLAEKKAAVQAVIDKVGGRTRIVVGAGTNCTASTLELVKEISGMAIDGLLIVGPYYNKPTQEGYYQHFAAVAKSTKLPIIVYNVPGRTASNIAPVTVARLARDFDNIVAVKEAAGNVAQTAELFRLLPRDFSIYSGDDGMVLPFMSVGATGLISVLSNIGGEGLQGIMQAYSDGRVKEAAELNAKLAPLCQAMFVETNPIPVKYAVTRVTGIDVGAPRLPLTEISHDAAEKVDRVLKEHNLL